MQFCKAERKKAKLRLALCGPSGSGKTFSALMIAKGIGGPVAMVDTESGSGELYADNPKIGLEYDVMQLGPPYTPQRAIEAIQAAQRAGYNVVIFDSLSHLWMGEGALLEMVDNAARGKQGNTFAGWKDVRPHERKFLEALTRTDIHIIATMRTKTEWTTTKDDRGKTRPVKVGLKPEQREGLEYEFTTIFDLSLEGNIASAGKDRTDLFKGQHFTPTEETGKKLLEWLERGVLHPLGIAAKEQVGQIRSLMESKNIFEEQDQLDRVNDWLARGNMPPVAVVEELTSSLANALIKKLSEAPAHAQ